MKPQSKSPENDYFKNLINSQSSKMNQVKNYLNIAESSHEQKIKTGSLHVKQTSDLIQLKRSNKMTKLQAESMRNMKKDLEYSLKLIDSRFEQLTESRQKVSTMKDEDRRKFITQMSKDQKEHEKKRQKIIQSQQQKQSERQIEEQQQAQKKDVQIRAKRKEQVMKKVESLDMIRKNKQIEEEKKNKQLKMKMQEKILSERMLEKFKQHEQAILNQRKKKLAEIRLIHKPLTKSDFELHLDKIGKLRSDRSRVVNQQEASRYISKQMSNLYRSRWYESSSKQQRVYQDIKIQQQRARIKEIRHKLKNYSEHVRQDFKPQINEKKAKTVKQLANTNLSSPNSKEARQIGLKYLQWSKEHGVGVGEGEKNKQQNQEDSESTLKKIKPINYLQQLKNNRKKQHKPKQIIDQLKNNKKLSETQKNTKIIQYIQGLQKKVKIREHKAKVNSMVVDEQLDEMYMEAISVKLQMLGLDK